MKVCGNGNHLARRIFKYVIPDLFVWKVFVLRTARNANVWSLPTPEFLSSAHVLWRRVGKNQQL